MTAIKDRGRFYSAKMIPFCWTSFPTHFHVFMFLKTRRVDSQIVQVDNIFLFTNTVRVYAVLLALCELSTTTHTMTTIKF